MMIGANNTQENAKQDRLQLQLHKRSQKARNKHKVIVRKEK